MFKACALGLESISWVQVLEVFDYWDRLVHCTFRTYLRALEGRKPCECKDQRTSYMDGPGVPSPSVYL